MKEEKKDTSEWNLLLGNGFSMWYASLFHHAEEPLLRADSIINVMEKHMSMSQGEILQHYNNRCQEEEAKAREEDEENPGDRDYRRMLYDFHTKPYYEKIIDRCECIFEKFRSNISPDEKKRAAIAEWLKDETDFEGIFNLFAKYKDLSERLYREHIKEIENLKKTIDKHKDYVRLIALLSIVTIHPDHPYNLKKKMDEKGVLGFFRKMRNIFTTNYDLILYWIIFLISKNEDDPPEKINPLFSDGFGYLSSTNLEFTRNFFSNRYFYLHGSFHIGMKDGEIVKLSRTNSDRDDKLLDQVMNMGDDFLPSCIVGGDAKQKRDAISKNGYLHACSWYFQKIKDNLVVFGHSLQRDEHIIDWIACNEELKHVFISYYDDESDINSQVEKIKEKRKKIQQDRQKKAANAQKKYTPKKYTPNKQNIYPFSAKDINWENMYSKLEELKRKANLPTTI